jgi:uncharacterized membrane-anchored protein YhcB (DUF1043 family)
MIEPFVALVLFALGLLSGVGLRAFLSEGRVRLRQLEIELESERQRYSTYRDRVEKHFNQTAHLFRDLTNQHAALYHHLAEGARELSPNPELLGGQAFGPALIEFADSASESEELPAALPARTTPATL